MTKTGFRVDDLGEILPWPDFRDFVNHLPPSEDSALFRARFPKSWWWRPEFDFYAALLAAAQWANWQRGGGKGDKPKPVKRPKEQPKTNVNSSEELAARKQALKRRRRGD